MFVQGWGGIGNIPWQQRDHLYAQGESLLLFQRNRYGLTIRAATKMPKLPSHWVKVTGRDPRTYYWNLNTNEVQLKHPLQEAGP